MRSSAPEVVELAALAGLFLDDWQQFVLEHALGEREDGKCAAFEVGLCVPRQNGKNGILEALELGCLFLDLMPAGGLVIHSAHLFPTSIEAFRRMDALLESNSDLSKRVRSVSRSHGEEGFVMRDRKRLNYKARRGGSGRGFTADKVVFDEAMDLPEMVIGNMMPMLSTVADPQIWYTASAVDQVVQQNGVVFSRVRHRGHEGEGALAWFEWSLDYDSPDEVPASVLSDLEAWKQANPALGIRIPADYVAKEHASMDYRTFAVERLGIGDWPNPEGLLSSVIGVEQWAALAEPGSVTPERVCFSIDTTPDRAWSTIAAAGKRPDGKWLLEVVDRRRGTQWVPGRVEELRKHDHCGWVVEGTSPAASLIAELEQTGLEVTAASASDHAKACGLIYDLVGDLGLRHLGTPELEAAVRGATQRTVGDAWAWSRKTSAVDISPLVACTLALWGAAAMLDAEPEVLVAWG